MPPPDDTPPPRQSSVRIKTQPGQRGEAAAPASLEGAAPAPPRPVDAYEAQYMGGGESLARSKKPMPWWFHAVLLFAAVAVVGSAVAAGQPGALVTLPLLLLAWILFTHLRVSVTAEKVFVQLGVFGPTIPVAQIERVSAERYNPVKYGGWGIRLGIDGTVAYSVPGGNGMALRIEYRTARGGRRTAVVSSDDAELLVTAIERARAAQTARVRVDAGSVAHRSGEQPRASAEQLRGAAAEEPARRASLPGSGDERER